MSLAGRGNRRVELPATCSRHVIRVNSFRMISTPAGDTAALLISAGDCLGGMVTNDLVAPRAKNSATDQPQEGERVARRVW